jgi:hypothetical protein
MGSADEQDEASRCKEWQETCDEECGRVGEAVYEDSDAKGEGGSDEARG